MSGHVDPARKQFKEMMELPDEGPIWMLNLIRLRKNAKYEDEREATGAEAYAAYARESEPFFTGVGGRIVWSGAPQFTLIGPDDERWDLCFVAEYPSAEAFANMVRDPGYQAVSYTHLTLPTKA
jgi:uncharacterized protein (DUF1330 family)